MSEVDLPRRLANYGGMADITRIALLRSQLGGLPNFPVESKRKDARHDWYVTRYGDNCWELDALDPNTLRESVYHAIEGYVDAEAWERAGVVEDAELNSLRDFFDTNPGIFGQDPK